ncbi:MAG TPA: hypothetical protein IAA13_08715 [Candidatus Alistipes merdigallinarum]|nr:hypothetical protein [Candidatus Alistipes merdigallinarum]
MKGLTTKQKLQLLEIADNIQKRAFYKPGDEIAFITLMRICRDYATSIAEEPQRDKFLLDRLKKYRIRFYEKI